MKEKSLKNKDTDIYWENVYYIYMQLVGLYDGYMSVAEEDKKFDFDEFIIIPSAADALDLISYISVKNRPNFIEMKDEEIKNYILLNSHCSALIKLADDYSDIWFGHNTWSPYIIMIRILKEYRFISNKRNEKSKTVSFSSYPATLFSTDDFYYLDSNLLVMETTISILNQKLYELINPESLLTWVRAILANRLSSSAEDWTNIFKIENSGTYNNQYMILDLNKIDLKNKKIDEKSLMIIEQYPGDFDINDATQYLKDGYWPSYNIPFSSKLYEKSGFLDQLKYRPDLYNSLNYSNCSRALIFKREQNRIKSNKDFEYLMRYNDYKNDNLSYKDPSLAIACRSDLNEYNCFGATDVKYISVKEILEGKKKMHIISGHSNVQQPTFSWKNTTCNQKSPQQWYHEGLVETWNFPWIEYEIGELKKSYEKKEGNNQPNEENNDNRNTKEENNDNRNKKIILIISIVRGIII